MGHVHINNPEYPHSQDMLDFKGMPIPRWLHEQITQSYKEHMMRTASKRSLTELLDAAKSIDFSSPGSFFISDDELSSMSKSDRAKLGRIMYHGVGKIVGAFLAKDKTDSGLVVSWGQS
jgi:hypothetical protein